MQKICELLNNSGGAALIIDYGHDKAQSYSVQGLKIINQYIYLVIQVMLILLL